MIFQEIDRSLPNPRKISNVFGQLGAVSSNNDNYAQLTLMAWAFGTLLTFDFCGNSMNLTEPNYEPVDIPQCDWFWDSGCEGNKTMPFYRTNYEFNQDGYVISI